MRKSDMDTEKLCKNCGRELFGRLDKRFCNDGCRNEFNRNKKKEEQIAINENIPAIFKIIKQNHAIMMSYGYIEDKDTSWTIEKSKLIKQGFDFRFFTTIDYHGDTLIHYCFEAGWSEFGQDTIAISYDLRKAMV